MAVSEYSSFSQAEFPDLRKFLAHLFSRMIAVASPKSLREAGLSETQAEAIVTVVEEHEGDLITKEYLDHTMRAEISELENRLSQKLITLGITINGLVLAGVYFMLNDAKQ
jgi:hypothetical protein